MSVLRACFRLCAVQALLQDSVTFAQDRVYDSNNEPLLDLLDVKEVRGKPFIVVYTDTDEHLRDTMESGIRTGTRATQVSFEMGVASAVMDKEGIKQLAMPRTDDGMELVLDFLQKEIIDAVFDNPRNEWSMLCRRMYNEVVRVSSTRSGAMGKGGHWAARQMVVTVDLWADPGPGEVLGHGDLVEGHVIYDFIEYAKVTNQPGTVQAAYLVEEFLSGTPHSSWEIAQSRLGLTRAGFRATGQAPLTDIGTGSTPYATEKGTPVVGPDGEPYKVTKIYGQDRINVPDNVPDGDPELEVKPYQNTDPNAP